MSIARWGSRPHCFRTGQVPLWSEGMGRRRLLECWVNSAAFGPECVRRRGSCQGESRDLLCAAHRNTLGEPAAGAGIRVGNAKRCLLPVAGRGAGRASTAEVSQPRSGEAARYGAGAQSGGRDHSVTRPRLRVVRPTVSTRRGGQCEVCSASQPSWLRPRKWCTGSTWSRGLLPHWEVARMDERPPADLRSADASKGISTMSAPGSLPRHVLAEDDLTAASPDLLRVPCQVLRVEVPLSCATGPRLLSFPPVHGWPWLWPLP